MAEIPSPRQLMADLRAYARWKRNDAIDWLIDWWLKRQR